MAKEYNKSDYVYCAKKSDGTWILYNFFEKKFLILSDFQKMIYDCAPYDDINSPFLKKLVQGGFLTCEDEYEKLLNRQIQKQKKDKLVKLTICPTMACNFSCSYCIETGQLRKGKMSEEIQNKTVQFVKKLLKKAKADSLQIIWFGGEPMLEIEIIQSLSEKLILLADSLKIPYTSGIYTNGYFLTEKNIRILEKCRVRTVRISVDGSQESHDRMRYLAG